MLLLIYELQNIFFVTPITLFLYQNLASHSFNVLVVGNRPIISLAHYQIQYEAFSDADFLICPSSESVFFLFVHLFSAMV